MKMIKKLSAIAVSAVMMFSIAGINAFAATTTQDGLEVTLNTDKQNYNKDDKITTTLSVKNTNDIAISNVSLENVIPDGYKLDDGSANVKQLETLNPNETAELSVVYVADSSSEISKVSQDSEISQESKVLPDDNTINTGDNSLHVMIIGIVIVASVLLTVLCFKSKKGRKLLSVILTVSMVGGSSALISLKTNAVNENTKTINVNTKVNADDREVTISAKVSYNIASSETKELCMVTFESNGGSDVTSISVPYGSTISAPEVPTKEGYIFVGWYVNSEFDEMFLFDEDVITDNVTLYADWISDDPDSVRAEWILDSIIIKYAQGDTANNVTRDITLPENIEDTDISWNSSNTTVVGKDGKVNRVNEEDTDIVLTAAVSVGNKTLTKSYSIKVIGKSTAISLEDYSVVDIQNMNEDGEVNIEYNDDRTQVTAIEGKYSDIVVKNSENAIDVVQEIRTIVGLSNAYEELELFYNSSDEYGSVYKFNQVYKGYEVYGHRLVVSVDQSGITDLLDADIITSSKLSGVNIDTYLSQDEAESIVKNHYGESFDINSSKTELIIYAIKDYINSPVLAYKVNITGKNNNNENVSETVFISTANKSIIDTENNVLDAETKTGSGKNEMNNKVSFPVTFYWNDWYFYYMEDMQRNIHLYREVSETNLSSGVIPIILDMMGYSSRYGSEFNIWTDKTAVSAYTNMITTYDWYKSKLRWDFVQKYGHELDVIVHNDAMTNNAFWDSDSEKIYFCNNSLLYKLEHNGIFFDTPTYASCLDVIGHEYTHSVVENIMGNMHYDRDYRGSINEGYADIFGCLIQGDWKIAEDRGTIRDASNPTLYHAPDKMSSSEFLNPSNYITDNEYNHRNDNESNKNAYSNKISAIAHKDSSLVYYAAYLMNSRGISKDTLAKLWFESMKVGSWGINSDFKTVRSKVISAAKKMKLSDNQLSIIRSAFDDEEVYSERGNISIKFVDADGKTMTEKVDVSVSMQRNEKDAPQPIFTIDTDTLGTTGKSDIYFGTYTTKIRISGYKSFEAKVTINEGETTELVVPVIPEGNGSISGTVTSATTGYAVDSVNIKVYDGWYQKEGTSISSTVSNSNGQYKFTLPAGYYTIEMSKEGYTTGYFNISIAGGKDLTNQNVSISPNMEFTKDFRVVLTWGQNPSDLDSHLIGKLADGSSYHVYYSNKNGYDSFCNKVANLDVDDTTSYGPETVTFTAETDGEYEYYVHWYFGTGTWATSGGKVEVYNNDQLVDVVNVPLVDNKNGDWKIFTFNKGIYTRYNTIT